MKTKYLYLLIAFLTSWFLTDTTAAYAAIDDPGGGSFSCYVCDKSLWRGVDDSSRCPTDPPTCNPEENTDQNWEGCVGGDAKQDGECDVIKDKCGDAVCGFNEWKSKECPLDCGDVVSGAGGPCTPIEIGKVKAVIPTDRKDKLASFQLEARDIKYVDADIWKTLNSSYDKSWELLRPAKDGSKTSSEAFPAAASRIVVGGKLEGAPDGSQAFVEQKLEVPENAFAQTHSRADWFSKIFSSPKSNTTLPNKDEKVTDAPSQNFQPQGKIVVPVVNQNFIEKVIGSVTRLGQDLINWLSGKQEVELTLTSCTPWDTANYKDSKEIGSFTKSAGKDDANTKYQNNSFEQDVILKTGNIVKNDKITLDTLASANIYKSIEDMVNNLRPAGADKFSFSQIASALDKLPSGTIGILSPTGSIGTTFKDAAKAAGVPVEMLYAIAHRESGTRYITWSDATFQKYSTQNWWNNATAKEITEGLAYNTCAVTKLCTLDVRGFMQFLSSTFDSVVNTFKLVAKLGHQPDMRNATDSIYASAFHLQELGKKAWTLAGEKGEMSATDWPVKVVTYVARAYCAGSGRMTDISADNEKACGGGQPGQVPYPIEAWQIYTGSKKK